jgi:carboxymethylenebutenolidase
MGETVRLTNPLDGFIFEAWKANPPDARRGGLVLVQEIFGVTEHIRELADGFAQDGYETLAPAFFERRAPGFQAGYDAEGVSRGRDLSEATPWDEVAADLQAAIDVLAPPVFVVGYCWGGTAAWLAACRCSGLAAASAYYGRRIPELLSEVPKVPIILHFGRDDASIPPATVEAIGAAHEELPLHLYDAGHGFASDRRADYRPDAARLARLRTLQLFARNAGAPTEM